MLDGEGDSDFDPEGKVEEDGEEGEAEAEEVWDEDENLVTVKQHSRLVRNIDGSDEEEGSEVGEDDLLNAVKSEASGVEKTGEQAENSEKSEQAEEVEDNHSEKVREYYRQ